MGGAPVVGEHFMARTHAGSVVPWPFESLRAVGQVAPPGPSQGVLAHGVLQPHGLPHRHAAIDFPETSGMGLGRGGRVHAGDTVRRERREGVSRGRNLHHRVVPGGLCVVQEGEQAGRRSSEDPVHPTASVVRDGWALDEVVVFTQVTRYEENDVKESPAEGNYLTGLFLEGCAWSKKENKLVDAPPKILFTALPVLFVTGVLKHQAKYDYATYDCPVYRTKSRTDGGFIFLVKPRIDTKASKWVLRGVCLLCSKD